MPAKKKARSKKYDTFLEQTIANIEERAKKEIDEIRERLEGGLEEATTRANQRSSKLEEAFDKRVAQAYNRMGLPSKADIVLLEAKIDDLQRTVDALLGANKPKATKKATKKTAKKAAKKVTKKSTARKQAPRKQTARKKAPRKKASAKKTAR